MHWDDLAVLRAIARHLSFRRGAAEMNLSAAAASQLMQRLARTLQES